MKRRTGTDSNHLTYWHWVHVLSAVICFENFLYTDIAQKALVYQGVLCKA